MAFAAPGRRSRRQVVVSLLLLGSAAALPLGGCGARDGRPVLRVSSQKGSTRSLMIAAGALEGAPYRVEWVELPSAANVLEAMGAGAVDIGLTGDTALLLAYQGGARVRGVQILKTAPDTTTTAIVVRRNKPIRTIADLKGKRIATGKGSVGHYLLLRVLEQAGLKPTDADIVFLTPGDAKVAFSSGAVDAWAIWSAYLGAAVLHDDAQVLIDGRGIMSGYSFITATETALAGKRALIADFLIRHAGAQRWSATHIDAYSAIYARETGLPQDVARFAALRNVRFAVPLDQAVLGEEADVLKRFVAAGLTQGTRPIDMMVDGSVYRMEPGVAS